ncbi:MAG: hypothetical protein ACKOA8_06980, partial [Deltaproteobacteria bacterium]
MKFLFLVLSMTEIIFAQSRFSVPHLELEMTGAEYQSFFRGSLDDEFDGELEPVMRIGKKYLDWLKKVNENRPEGMKLSLSSPENQPGYPIESPRVSSPKLILESLSQLKSQLPEELKSTVLGSTQINHVLPVSDEVFVFWGRQIDELYARASRWLLQEPYLWAYADRKHDDVRGYYYLSRVLEVEEKLLQWKNLSQETQTQYQIWLEGLCFNGGSSSSECREEFQETIQKIGHPKDFYLKFLPKGQEKWAGLFNITQKRDDIIWKGEEPKTLKTPFTQPESQEVKTFLSENIEDE